MLEASVEIPSAIRIPEGISAIGGFFAEFSSGWQSPDGLFVVNRSLDGLSKAGGETGRSSAVEGSPEVAPSVSGSV